jgi:hypothetical protein
MRLSLFERIDVPWVKEVITERFDFHPIDCMTGQSLIYGGAIRDSIAGIRLQGDLDIVVSPDDFRQVVDAINNSPRWRMYGSDIPKRARRLSPARRSAYGEHVPLDKIVRFRNMHDVEIEVIMAKELGGQNPEILVPEMVDIVCCGVAMDRSGKVYEIVKGAFQDCKNRLLHFNTAVADVVDVDRMVDRIKKLERRGWKSEIDVDKIRKHRKRVDKIKAVEDAKKRRHRRSKLSDRLCARVRSKTRNIKSYDEAKLHAEIDKLEWRQRGIYQKREKLLNDRAEMLKLLAEDGVGQAVIEIASERLKHIDKDVERLNMVNSEIVDVLISAKKQLNKTASLDKEVAEIFDSMNLPAGTKVKKAESGTFPDGHTSYILYYPDGKRQRIVVQLPEEIPFRVGKFNEDEPLPDAHTTHTPVENACFEMNFDPADWKYSEDTVEAPPAPRAKKVRKKGVAMPENVKEEIRRHLWTNNQKNQFFAAMYGKDKKGENDEE